MTAITAVGLAVVGIMAWKTTGYALELHDPLTAVSVIVLALVCLAAGAWALHGTWGQGA